MTSTHDENIMSKFIKQNLWEIKEKKGRNMLLVVDFNTPLSARD